MSFWAYNLLKSRFPSFLCSFEVVRKLDHQRPLKFILWPSHSHSSAILQSAVLLQPYAIPRPSLRACFVADFRARVKIVDKFQRIKMHRRHQSFNRGSHTLVKRVERRQFRNQAYEEQIQQFQQYIQSELMQQDKSQEKAKLNIIIHRPLLPSIFFPALPTTNHFVLHEDSMQLVRRFKLTIFLFNSIDNIAYNKQNWTCILSNYRFSHKTVQMRVIFAQQAYMNMFFKRQLLNLLNICNNKQTKQVECDYIVRMMMFIREYEQYLRYTILRGCQRLTSKTIQIRKSEIKSTSCRAWLTIFLILRDPLGPNLAFISPPLNSSFIKCWIQASRISFLAISRSIKLDRILFSFIRIISSSFSYYIAALNYYPLNSFTDSIIYSFCSSLGLTAGSKISLKIDLVGCLFLVTFSQTFLIIVLLLSDDPICLMYCAITCFMVMTNCLVILWYSEALDFLVAAVVAWTVVEVCSVVLQSYISICDRVSQVSSCKHMGFIFYEFD